MNFNYNDIAEAYNKAKENTFEQLYGKFVVKVEKIELGQMPEQSKQAGMPTGKIQFRIVEGQYKKKPLFMSKLLVCRTQDNKLMAIGLSQFDTFLASLKPGFVVSFSECTGAFKEDDPDNYQNLLFDVAEAVQKNTYEIEVTKTTVNGKDYPEYKVLEMWKD